MERNEKLYNQLFKKYWKEILHFSRKKLGDTDEAKDATEDAFMKMWIHFEKFTDEKNAKSFIYVVARNNCLNILATKKRHPYTPIDFHVEDLLIEMPLDFGVIESEVISFILAEIKKLPISRRQSIELLLAGYNSTEVANKLGKTRKTVLNQKLDVIAHLRNLVKLKFEI